MRFSFFDQFYWFSGVVESIQDPLNQGRVQVRAIGFHPDSKTLVPTADLPWAHVMLPTTSAGVSGIGATHGLVEGSWVVGFFSDGRDAQQPIIMGTIPGNPNPSRVQQTLINSGQSISSTGADGISGLTQSVSTSQVGSTTGSAYGPTISDAADAVDLSDYKDLLSSGVDSASLVSGGTVQANSILSVVSTASDLRATQLFDVISNSEKLRANPVEGQNVLNYVSKYTGKSASDILGVSKFSNVNANRKSNTVDVNTNYEKALDSSTASAGMITIEHNSVRRSAASMPVARFKGLDQYHFVVTAQGQVFPKEQLGKTGTVGDDLDTIVSRGATSNSVRVLLIGGLPDDPKYDATANFNERFTVAQLNATKRLITVLLKKYPKAVIDGPNNLVKNGSATGPNFNVSATFKELFPDNVNVSGSGPKVAGVDNVTTSSISPTPGADNTGFHDPRGLYPAINYGQDYPVVGRYNGITNAKRLPPVIEAIKGNLSKFSTHDPRNASDRTAVGVLTPKQVPVPDWGGEYGMAHVIRETPGGHAIYADDTPGKERMVIASPTGSVHEIRPDGSVVSMAQGDSYTLAQGSHHLVTNGDASETINGNKKIKIAGDLILEVGGRFAVVSAETNEFVHGHKTSIVEGVNKTQSKAGHFIEVGKDYGLDVGGNRQDITAGTFVDQAGLSRSTVTTGGHTTKSNYSVDQTLGNRTVMTKGDLSVASNGKTSVFSKGDLSTSTAGNFSTAATGSAKHFAASMEHTTGGKFSLNASGGVGVNAGGGNITFDGGHYSFDEGTIAESSSAPTITTYDMPETIQPISTVASPESNPAASDFTFGQRQEMEAHDELGNNTQGGSRSAFNSGATRNTTSPVNPANGAKSNFDSVSLGSSAASGCEVANKLKAGGMTEEAASAYAGAFMQESRFNPSATNGIGATGIAQWTSSGGRKESMQSYLGSRSNDLDGQIEYVFYELNNNPNGAAGGAATTWKTSDLNEAVKSAAYYERFNGYESARNGVYSGGEWGNRSGYAASIYKDCFGKDPGSFNPAPSFDPNAGLNDKPGNANGPNTGTGVGPEQRGSEANTNLPPMSDKYTDRNQKISEFFTLADLLQSGGNKFDMPAYIDTPSGRISADEIVANLSRLAVNVLDVVTRRLGKVTVHSGLRPPYYNARIGGAKNSQHMYGRAADITVAGYSPSQVHAYVRDNIPACHGLGSYATFTHVDVRPTANRSTWSG